MSIKRHFIGWDDSALAGVRKFLVSDDLNGPLDLGNDLIVVPTRQAGRRLREALALFCAEHDAALLSARVVMPTYFMHADDGDRSQEANGILIKTVWIETLLECDPENVASLLPPNGPDRDFSWALSASAMLQKLRETLADGGFSICDVPEYCGDDLEEPERWQSMTELEKDYLARLKERGFSDPTVRKISRAESMILSEDVKRIVVASVPDPSLLMIQTLNRLKDKVPIDVLVTAPESLADIFDEWGRPISAKWHDRKINIPNPEESILLAGTPRSQAERVIDEVARSAGQIGPADIAIGAPDKEVIPFLETSLTELGLSAFDPSDKNLKEHVITGLLNAYADMVTDSSYAALRTFLRHPDVLSYLVDGDGAGVEQKGTKGIGERRRGDLNKRERRELEGDGGYGGGSGGEDLNKRERRGLGSGEQGAGSGEQANCGEARRDKGDQEAKGKTSSFSVLGLLRELDRFQNERLPAGFSDLIQYLEEGKDEDNAHYKEALAMAAVFIHEQIEFFNEHSLEEAVRGFLQTIYKRRMISSAKPEDKEFEAAATEIDKALRELRDVAPLIKTPDKKQLFAVLLQRLDERSFHADRDDSVIDIEGWLELPWNDAPLLIVTGMNEGKVPDGRLSDLFLPDSLRTRLGLRNDSARLARDAYLLTAMIESRRERGAGSVERRRGFEQKGTKGTKGIGERGSVERRAESGDPRRSSGRKRRRADFKQEEAEATEGEREADSGQLTEESGVRLIVGKTSSVGDPLKPSRLLFRCDDAELSERAKRLFADATEKRPNHPSQAGFKLHPQLPEDVPEKRRNPQKLSVTSFRDYLACPFRYYLRRVLGMEHLSDDKRELDALDFGLMVHSALRKMVVSNMWRAEEKELGAFLTGHAETWVKERFSGDISVPIMIALDSARQRLLAAARVQVGLVNAGWEIVESEKMYEMNLQGITVRGIIDRVDRNSETGTIRIIDYKTTDRGSDPVKIHLTAPGTETREYTKTDVNGRIRKWSDLQLPLYLQLLKANGEIGTGDCELAFFSLPKAVTNTGINVWNGFNDELAGSAAKCADAVVEGIKKHEFWPPSERVKYDDFEALLFGGRGEVYVGGGD